MTPQVILLVAILCVCQSGSGAVQEETVTLRSRSGVVLSSWIDLLPKVVSCYMSLAGILFPWSSNNPNLIHLHTIVLCTPDNSNSRLPPVQLLPRHLRPVCAVPGVHHLVQVLKMIWSNITTTTPPCCSLAVVKTCSSLVIASLQQRFD